MITGIGTPSNHNRIPRPIVFSSMYRKENVRAGRLFLWSSGRSGVEWREGYARGIVRVRYQWPVFGIDAHGSAGGLGSPFCSNSIECRSGERTNAI